VEKKKNGVAAADDVASSTLSKEKAERKSNNFTKHYSVIELLNRKRKRRGTIIHHSTNKHQFQESTNRPRSFNLFLYLEFWDHKRSPKSAKNVGCGSNPWQIGGRIQNRCVFRLTFPTTPNLLLKLEP